MTKNLSSGLYKEILKKIKNEIVRGRRIIEQSYHQQVLQTYWNIGKILEEPFKDEFRNSSDRASMVSRIKPAFSEYETCLYFSQYCCIIPLYISYM